MSAARRRLILSLRKYRSGSETSFEVCPRCKQAWAAHLHTTNGTYATYPSDCPVDPDFTPTEGT